MHELPGDLKIAYDDSEEVNMEKSSEPAQNQSGDAADLEKGPEPYGDDEFERAMNDSESSHILVYSAPTHSPAWLLS